VTLLAFAAERRSAAPLLVALGAATVDKHLPLARRSAANPPQAAVARQMTGQTDGRSTGS